METRYLLDTNICIYIRRHKPLEVLRRFERLRPGEAAISVVTAGELLCGAEKSAHRIASLERLRELFLVLPPLSLPETAAAAYGSFRSDLERRGEMIGNNDLWIAAHAAVERLVLVTNDEREFSRVRNLKVQNWTEA
jgi:tRNA(fMet)-specific endonuclease VapC